jgi:S1-C subfamily serine protease
MGLKGMWICAVLACLVTPSIAQQSKLTFDATPRNAQLILDGEEIGDANDRKVVIGFNARKGIRTHTIVVRAPGFDDVSFEFGEDTPAKKHIKVDLNRSMPSFDLASDALMDFGKVTSALSYGSDVGANTKWKYKYDDEIEIGDRRLKITSAMHGMGLPTLQATPEPKPAQADIAVSGVVTNVKLVRGTEADHFSIYSFKGSVTTTITWYFYHRVTKDTLFEVPSTNFYEFFWNDLNDEFYNAVVENFIFMFSTNKSLEKEIIAFDEELVEQARQIEAERLRQEEAKRKAKADSIARSLAEDTLIYPIEIDSAQLQAALNAGLKLPKLGVQALDEVGLEQQSRKATVSIKVESSNEVLGGTILSKDGYIVTAALPEGQAVRVQFYNGILLEAEVVQNKPDLGIALLKVDARNLAALEVIDGKTVLQKTELVLSWNAAKIRSLEAQTVRAQLIGKEDVKKTRYLITDLGRSDVSAGSGLIDARGRLVGILVNPEKDVLFNGMTAAIDARYLYYAFGLSYE